VNAGTVSVLGRLDGSTVTIGTQPGASDVGRVVLLRIQSPMLDLRAATFLAADEARLLADVLSSAADAATAVNLDTAGPVARHPGGPRPNHDEPPNDEPPNDGGMEGNQHIVCAAEDTTVEELGLALASVPAHSRLTDFASDVDVTLFFTAPPMPTPPPAGTPETPAGGHGRKADRRG
jgi:uncharacterized repeat protein (TIGR03917 family)